MNQIFLVHYGSGETLPVSLLEINLWGLSPDHEGVDALQPFALIFQSTNTSYLTQATYRVSHESLGEQDIFMVPIGPNSVGMRYEATFS
jgi:hypothetical protein